MLILPILPFLQQLSPLSPNQTGLTITTIDKGLTGMTTDTNRPQAKTPRQPSARLTPPRYSTPGRTADRTNRHPNNDATPRGPGPKNPPSSSQYRQPDPGADNKPEPKLPRRSCLQGPPPKPTRDTGCRNLNPHIPAYQQKRGEPNVNTQFSSSNSPLLSCQEYSSVPAN